MKRSAHSYPNRNISIQKRKFSEKISVMILEVLKGRLYVILIAKDENDQVLGILPLKISELFKNIERTKEEIVNFFKKIDNLPPSRIVFSGCPPLIMKVIENSMKKLELEINMEIERIKKIGEKLRTK